MIHQWVKGGMWWPYLAMPLAMPQKFMDLQDCTRSENFTTWCLDRSLQLWSFWVEQQSSLDYAYLTDLTLSTWVVHKVKQLEHSKPQGASLGWQIRDPKYGLLQIYWIRSHGLMIVSQANYLSKWKKCQLWKQPWYKSLSSILISQPKGEHGLS